jgi:hypothetical protein
MAQDIEIQWTTGKPVMEVGRERWSYTGGI